MEQDESGKRSWLSFLPWPRHSSRMRSSAQLPQQQGAGLAPVPLAQSKQTLVGSGTKTIDKLERALFGSGSGAGPPESGSSPLPPELLSGGVDQLKARLVAMAALCKQERERGRILQGALQQERPSKGEGSTEAELPKVDFRSAVQALRFDKKGDGVGLSPPIPSDDEILKGTTVCGPVITLAEGLVLQGGPYRSVWIRVRPNFARPNSAGAVLLEHCVKSVVDALRSHEVLPSVSQVLPNGATSTAKKPKSGALYVAFAEGGMSGAASSLLRNVGFTFYAARHQNNAKMCEYVYVLWPHAPMPSPVHPYATSIEGVCGVILDPTASSTLLVWDRNSAWSTAAGAVEPGESSLSALERELQEEVSVTIDRSAPILYLGGYQETVARDGIVNDNFRIFAVRAATSHFEVDGNEVLAAKWVDWRALHRRWREAIQDGAQSSGRYVELDWGQDIGTAKVSTTLLKCLDAIDSGRHLVVAGTALDQKASSQNRTKYGAFAS